GPLLDVRARGRPAQDGLHLLGHAGEPGDQHGQRGGVVRQCRGAVPRAHAGLRRSTQLPLACTAAVQPPPTQIVQSASTITAGPSTGPRRLTGGSESRSTPLGTLAVARTATTSTAVPSRR